MNLKHPSKQFLIAGMIFFGSSFVALALIQYFRLWHVFLCSYHTMDSAGCAIAFDKQAYLTLPGILLLIMQTAATAGLAVCLILYLEAKKRK